MRALEERQKSVLPAQRFRAGRVELEIEAACHGREGHAKFHPGEAVEGRVQSALHLQSRRLWSERVEDEVDVLDAEAHPWTLRERHEVVVELGIVEPAVGDEGFGVREYGRVEVNEFGSAGDDGLGVC